MNRIQMSRMRTRIQEYSDESNEDSNTKSVLGQTVWYFGRVKDVDVRQKAHLTDFGAPRKYICAGARDGSKSPGFNGRW